MKYVSKLKGTIKEKNVQFKAMCAEDQRREIALDALKIMDHELIRPQSGVYWSRGLYTITDGMSAEALCKFLNEDLYEDENKGCDVCAKGATMISMIRLGNTLDGHDGFRDGSATEDTDVDYFGFTQFEMDRIEQAFEGWELTDLGMELNEEYDPYPIDYRGSDYRLRNIYLNILKHGAFKMDDHTDYVHI